jgi:hypothetical protein
VSADLVVSLRAVNPEFRKVALIAACLGLIVSVFFALQPDDEDDATATTAAATTAETTTPATTESETSPATTAPPPDAPVTLRIAVPADAVPTVQELSVRRGREVVIVVSTELTDHVHLHGYDLTADVGPGRPGRIAFTADSAGIFEIELEERGLPIAELEVRP